MKVKHIAIIGAVAMIILLIAQRVQIEELEGILGTVKPVDTFVVQGEVVQIHDTVTIKQVIVKHKVDTVVKSEDNSIIVYDTVVMYKEYPWDIKFADSIASPLVSIYGVAHYPSGKIDLVLANKVNLKSLDNRLRFYTGVGYRIGDWPFVQMTATMSNYQLTFMGGRKVGFAIGKKF